MASFVKFEIFSEDLSKGTHQFHAAGHQVGIYLTNTGPNVATNAVKANLAEITVANGYLGFADASTDIQNDISRTGGTTSVTGVDRVITATGAVGPFRYTVLANNTPTSPADPLVGYWDYGASGVTLANGETFTVDFGSSVLTIA